jgi:hypothetical protein
LRIKPSAQFVADEDIEMQAAGMPLLNYIRYKTSHLEVIFSSSS